MLAMLLKLPDLMLISKLALLLTLKTEMIGLQKELAFTLRIKRTSKIEMSF